MWQFPEQTYLPSCVRSDTPSRHPLPTKVIRKPRSLELLSVIASRSSLTLSTRRERRRTSEAIRSSRSSSGRRLQGSECTVQYEGVADEPFGSELERLLDLYFGAFPDGRSRRSWPGLIYVRMRPTWIRFSNFSADPPEIVEFRSEDLDNRESYSAQASVR